MMDGHATAFVVGVDLPFDPFPPLRPRNGDLLSFKDTRMVFHPKLLNQLNPAVSFLVHCLYIQGQASASKGQISHKSRLLHQN
jgi:hypothetical protein